jgi:hypothetical protein
MAEQKVEACDKCGESRKDHAVYCNTCGRPFPEVKVSEASAYWEVLPMMRDMARRLGWCLALYGPLRRDLDMVAIPWVEDAVPHNELLREIINTFGGRTSNTLIDESVGRTGVKVVCRKRVMRDNGSYVDVSIIDPRIEKC